MTLGSQKNDSDSTPGPSLDGSFRMPESVASVQTTSYKVLKEYAAKLIEVGIFTKYLEDWVTENLYGNNEEHFSSPFSTDDIRTFDFALEGVQFQQLLRMPCPSYTSENLKEDACLALEDFLHTAAEGLWHAFWHKNAPLPFYVSFPRHPRSKFYTIEKAKTRGRIEGLSGATLMSKSKGNSHARWDDVAEFVLFRELIVKGKDIGYISPSVICEALFYGIHILFSRRLSKRNTVTSDYVFVSVIDSTFGGVIKLGGDFGKLEVDLNNPYHSIVEWLVCHAEVSISSVDRIWNRLGNVNWRDFGTLQILLATFYSISQWYGPPRKSMASLAAKHSLRLQNRRMGNHLTIQKEKALVVVPYQHQEIVEMDHEVSQYSKTKVSHLKLSPGEILLLEDQNQGLKSFQIQNFLNEEKSSYIACACESPSEYLTLFVGAHPSRLEPSWEDMNLWYQVQRQTKVLNIFKEHGTSSKNLPEIIASGKILHNGPCEKQTPKDLCKHPFCGTPILVSCPVGQPLSLIISHEGPFSPEEATRCCRDCLSALRKAKIANIMHGDIIPENIIRIIDGQTSRNGSLFVLVSWGRAVLEERDSPALNLSFSSAHALEKGKLCPSSDVESLIYLIYFITGGTIQEQDSIESALKWRKRSWGKRVIQKHLGEVSPILKAFADYVDSICGTPYSVDYDVWLKRLNRGVDGLGERGKMVEEVLRLKDLAESSGTSL